MQKLEIDVREAWNQINELLGHKVITIDILSHPDWQNPEVLEKFGIERYILTPDEVIKYFPILQESTNRFANPEPRREQAIEILLNDNCSNVAREEYEYANQPRYWISRLVNIDKKTSVWTDCACLMPTQKQIPMQKIGEKDGIPIIYYDYYRHSGERAYSCYNSYLLLKKIKDVGITEPE